jgi:energy-coupling factor transporter transmembrane protein EcfT
MALAMDARSYGSSLIRSTMAEFHFRWKDAAALVVAAASITLIILL